MKYTRRKGVEWRRWGGGVKVWEWKNKGEGGGKGCVCVYVNKNYAYKTEFQLLKMTYGVHKNTHYPRQCHHYGYAYNGGVAVNHGKTTSITFK